MKALASSLLVIAGCIITYALTLREQPESRPIREYDSSYFEQPKDWAEDSTVSYDKKIHCEYLLNKTEEQ